MRAAPEPLGFVAAGLRAALRFATMDRMGSVCFVAMARLCWVRSGLVSAIETPPPSSSPGSSPGGSSALGVLGVHLRLHRAAACLEICDARLCEPGRAGWIPVNASDSHRLTQLTDARPTLQENPSCLEFSGRPRSTTAGQTSRWRTHPGPSPPRSHAAPASRPRRRRSSMRSMLW